MSSGHVFAGRCSKFTLMKGGKLAQGSVAVYRIPVPYRNRAACTEELQCKNWLCDYWEKIETENLTDVTSF